MSPQHLLLTSAAVLSAVHTPCAAFTGAPGSGTFAAVVPASAFSNRATTAFGTRRNRLRSETSLDALDHHSFDDKALEELAEIIAVVNGGVDADAHATPFMLTHQPQSPPSPGRSTRRTDVDMVSASSERGMPWTETFGRTEETEPLLYMPFWTWQLDFMESTLTNLHPIECRTTSGVDASYNENSDKRARIVNHCYASDEYRKIRMTYYDAGDAVQVFNSVWYPDAKYDLPVLGIDLLSFNRKKYLAIVDFQPLHDKEEDHAASYEDLLKPIKDKYDSLKGRMSSKFYDETQFFSKQMLFARFEDGDVVEQDLFPAFRSYVETHVDLVKGVAEDVVESSEEVDAHKVLDRQQAYDTYSAERDPAAGLFASMFGKEWAEDFIYDFLFSLSERKEGGLDFSPPGPPRPRPAQKKEEEHKPSPAVPAKATLTSVGKNSSMVSSP